MEILNRDLTIFFTVPVSEAPSPQGLLIYLNKELGKHWSKYQWIPQTLGDLVWVWIEAKSEQDKETILKNLPEKYIKLITDFSLSEVEHWAKIGIKTAPTPKD